MLKTVTVPWLPVIRPAPLGHRSQLVGREGNVGLGTCSAKVPNSQWLDRVPLGATYTPILDTGKLEVDHDERLASPFDKATDSKIGEAAKVFRLTVKSVTR